MQNEVHDKDMREFWEEHGTELLYRLICDGLPICKYRCIPPRPQPDSGKEPRLLERGIIFEQVRYKKRNKKEIKTKWIYKELGKNKKLVCRCVWRFIPLGIEPKERLIEQKDKDQMANIEPKKKSIDPKDQVYVYLMQVEKFSAGMEEPVFYQAKIETRWNGSLIRQTCYTDDSETDSPNESACPTGMQKTVSCQEKIETTGDGSSFRHGCCMDNSETDSPNESACPTGMQKTVSCQEKIETTGNGSSFRHGSYTDNPETDFPYRSEYPKRMIAKVNRCLVRNYWPLLWNGFPYAAWVHTDERVSVYMAMPQYFDRSLKALQSAVLALCKYEVSAVLMSYTCFAILKPFFPSYHQLSKQSTYLKVRRGIGDLLSINIYSDPPEHAENLAKRCCGFFTHFDKNFVIDGIAIEDSNSKQIKPLGMNEFEAKILQSACVLWVNRKPSEELLQSGRIISLHVDFSEEMKFESVSKDIVAVLANQIYDMTETAKVTSSEKVSQSGRPIVKNFIDAVDSCAEKYGLSLVDADLEENRYFLASSQIWFPGDAVKYVKSLQKAIKLDMLDYLDNNAGPLIQRDVRRFENEINALGTGCIKALTKIDKDTVRSNFTFSSEYKNAVKNLAKHPLAHDLEKGAIKKIAYLSASFKVFSQKFLPGPAGEYLSKKTDDALMTILSNQIIGQKPESILEKYILHCVINKQCARIRGKNSDHENIAIWYDPPKALFLLPTQKYFVQLADMFGVTTSKNLFEEVLAQEGLICTVLRKNKDREQTRRSFEICLAANGKKESVLKVRLDKLSPSFHADPTVQRALIEMAEDNTSFRSPRNPNTIL